MSRDRFGEAVLLLLLIALLALGIGWSLGWVQFTTGGKPAREVVELRPVET